MFDTIIKLLPEWVMPVLFGVVVWFGANYAFLAPEIGRRTIENDCPSGQSAFCHCVGGYLISNARWELALWTSSLGMYSVAQSAPILVARQEGVKQCRP